MKIFDCHSHWGTQKGYVLRTEAELARQEKVFRTRVQYVSEDEQAAYFRANGARVILDLSWIKKLPIAEMREYHDYANAHQRAHPDVVFGNWLQFDPRVQTVPEALAEFDRVLAAGAGFTGLIINGQVTGIPASDEVWAPFYRRSIDAGLPVMIFTGLTGIGQGLPGGLGIRLDDGHPRHIDAVAAAFPDLRVLAARAAYPWQDDMIAILLHKANVSYELHGWSPRQFSPALKAEIAGRLQDRVMFGCDFPVLRYEKLIQTWRGEGYSDEVLDKVFLRNAEAYFGG